MKSKWYELKPKAIELRQQGLSIGRIEKELGITRSTLSGWLKNITLTPRQKRKLIQDCKAGLKKARKKAVLWNHD